MSTVQVGDTQIEFGTDDFIELEDSSDVLGDDEALRERLAADGYLYIEGLHDPDLVRAARREVLECMAEDGLLDPSEPVGEGVAHPDIGSFEWDMGRGSRWAHYPLVEKLSTGETTTSLMESIVDEEVYTLGYRWGRAKAKGDFTPFHSDLPFMSLGTDRLYTKWQPVGDCPMDLGPLLVVPGSHRTEAIREIYCQLDYQADDFGPMLTDDPYDVIDTFGCPLATTNFEAGDALVLSCYTLHASLTNRTDRIRISIDNRYQPLSEPADPRLVDDDPIPDIGPIGDHAEQSRKALKEQLGLTPSDA